jgi:hypothetical protein
MAAPNLLSSTTVTGKTVMSALTTVTANVLTNSAGSGTVDKLNNVILTNSTSTAVYANVMINRSSTAYPIGGNVSIPGYSTLVLLGKDTSVYLEEGDVLQANVSANSAITMVSSYELISAT